MTEGSTGPITSRPARGVSVGRGHFRSVSAWLQPFRVWEVGPGAGCRLFGDRVPDESRSNGGRKSYEPNLLRPGHDGRFYPGNRLRGESFEERARGLSRRVRRRPTKIYPKKEEAGQRSIGGGGLLRVTGEDGRWLGNAIFISSVSWGTAAGRRLRWRADSRCTPTSVGLTVKEKDGNLSES